MEAGMNRETGCWDSVLPERPPGQKESKPLQGIEEPSLADIQPPRSKTPRRERRNTSTRRDLANMREAHWRALATLATWEEKIERLSQSVTWGWSDVCAHSWSWDCCRRRSWGWNRRYCRVWPEESPAPFFEYSPPHGVQDLRRTKRQNHLSWIWTWSHHQS